jgi:non-heme chloroperoxidase
MLLKTRLETSLVTIRDGIEIPFAEQGEADGLPILFLHGYSDSWHSFEEILSPLPRSLRAIALSQRGHGDASRPQSGYSASDFAADLASFMDVLGIEAAVIVGHSMGSSIAQRFAIDFPSRTIGLVLAGSYSTTKGNPGVEELVGAISALADPVDPDFVRSFQESTLAQPISPEFLNTIIIESLKLPARVWKAVAASLARDDHSERLREIRVPTLIVWGDRDEFFPRAEQFTLRAAIPHARFLVYPAAGHAVHWEEPDRFAADVAAFVTSFG